MKKLSGKVAVVTGAASGIGRSLAVQLAQRGCNLAIADIDLDKLAETASQVEGVGVRCSSHQLDVADRRAFEQFAQDVVERHGAVHVVINNAGVTLIDLAEQMSYEDFEWIMNINFWGVVHGTKSFLPHLREQDEAHIVNISSLFGLMSMPLQSAYNASKFAVRGFTEALKMELSGSSIGVTCVHPGGIKTDITRNSRIGANALEVPHEELHADFDKAALTTPDKAGATIIRGIEKNKRRVLIGPDARLLSFVVRLFPGSYEKVLRLEKDVRRRARERQAQSSS